MTGIHNRRVWLGVTLLALYFRMEGTRIGGPELDGALVPVSQPAWWRLAEIRRQGWLQVIGLGVPWDSWLLGLFGLFAGIGLVWAALALCGTLQARRQWKEEDLFPFWVAPAMLALLPGAWQWGSLGADGFSQLTALMLVLSGLGFMKNPFLGSMGLLAAFTGLLFQTPAPWVTDVWWDTPLQSPISPGGEMLDWLTPFGVFMPLLALTPVMIWRSFEPKVWKSLLPPALIGTLMACWQARFLPMAAPWLALGVIATVNSLWRRYLPVPKLPHRLAGGVLVGTLLVPCFLVRRQDPYPLETAGVAQVLKQSADAGFEGRVFAHWQWGTMIRALSHMEPVADFTASGASLRGLGAMTPARFEAAMTNAGAQWFLGTTGLLGTLPDVLVRSGEWSRRPPGYPVTFKKDTFLPGFRVLGAPNVYNLPAWHLSAALGTELLTRDTSVPYLENFSLRAVSAAAAEVNFEREQRQAPVAVLFKRVKGREILITATPGERILGRLPLVLTLPGGKDSQLVFEARAHADKMGTARLHLPYWPGTTRRGALHTVGHLRIIWEEMVQAKIRLHEHSKKYPLHVDKRQAKPINQSR